MEAVNWLLEMGRQCQTVGELGSRVAEWLKNMCLVAKLQLCQLPYDLERAKS